ncbi:MAG: UvrB/UvrC motif-containing protein [Planctomycetota bacterium]|nr:UvrB/UvrC motif-containing protein [Planctomycetota bacterium]
MNPMQRTRLDDLLQKARSLDAVPGVYILKAAEGRVLYVGKALRLPDRVSSYFLPSADVGDRKQPMLAEVETFEVIPCESEWEALLMEARLIKDLRPPYNAMLTDGKTFPYLVVTTRDEFPGVYFTREPTADRFRGGRIYGPFTRAGDLRHAVQVLQRIFRFRTCEMEIREDDPRNRSFRPCLLHDIHQCTAPCASRVSRESYRADLDRFLRFLGTKRTSLVRELTREMDAASADQRYEEAAALRDQLRAIERLGMGETPRGDPELDWPTELTVFASDPEGCVEALGEALGAVDRIRCIECIDIAHLAGNETVGSKVCFIDGRPFKEGYRRYRVRSAGNDDFTAIREIVSRRYREAGEGHELFPDLVLIDGGQGQLSAAMEVFSLMEVRPPLVASLAKREEVLHLAGRDGTIRLAKRHKGLRLCMAIRDEAHRFAQHYHHILRKKRVLGEEAP